MRALRSPDSFDFAGFPNPTLARFHPSPHHLLQLRGHDGEPEL